MKLLSSLAIAGMILSLAGCGNSNRQSTSTTYASPEALAAYRTWAWSPKRTLILRDPTLNAAAVKGWIEAAVESEMASKGFTKAGGGSADVLVSFSAASVPMATSQIFSTDGELSGNLLDEEGATAITLARTGTLNTSYEQGRMHLDLLERKSGKKIYRGSTELTMLKQPSPEKSVSRINAMVRDMLKKLPKR